jgi:hypothetical protein
MSLKDYAMRKRKQREEEMADQAASSVSPGSTTSALEPGNEMEGVESREVASENGEAGTLWLFKRLQKMIRRLFQMEWKMMEETARS